MMPGLIVFQATNLMILMNLATILDPAITTKIIFRWEDPDYRPWWVKDLSSLDKWYNIWLLRHAGFAGVVICLIPVVEVAARTPGGFFAWAVSMGCSIAGLRPLIVDRFVTELLAIYLRGSRIRSAILQVISVPLATSKAVWSLIIAVGINAWLGVMSFK